MLKRELNDSVTVHQRLTGFLWCRQLIGEVSLQVPHVTKVHKELSAAQEKPYLKIVEDIKRINDELQEAENA